MAFATKNHDQVDRADQETTGARDASAAVDWRLQTAAGQRTVNRMDS